MTETKGWIILATPRDVRWQRFRYGLAAVAIFVAGVAYAGVIWR